MDLVTPRMVEAACEARNMVAGTAWHDGMTEGVQAIERMLAERMIEAALRARRLSKEETMDQEVGDWKHGLGPSAVILRDEGDGGFMPIAFLAGEVVYLSQSDSLVVMTREVARQLADVLQAQTSPTHPSPGDPS